MAELLIVSSSRADVGILSPVWNALLEQGADTAIFATGMHLEPEAADSFDHVPDTIPVLRGGAPLGGGGALDCAEAQGTILAAAGRTIAERDPAGIVVTGDRLDMFPAALAAVPFNKPIMHLHGGEVTEGAVDDRLRHAMTKLADCHCVSNADARDRVVAMGEAAETVFVTGAPGLDTVATAERMTPEAFAEATGLEDGEGFILVTVHPETNSATPLASAEALFAALRQIDRPVLVTAPNSDPGGRRIREAIDAFLSVRPGNVFLENLGMTLYANAQRLAGVMAGNSSSGMIEAGLFGTPVVDIGDRQTGRLHGENVKRVPNDPGHVLSALQTVLQARERYPAGTPYGDGKAGPRIAEAIRRMVA